MPLMKDLFSGENGRNKTNNETEEEEKEEEIKNNAQLK